MRISRFRRAQLLELVNPWQVAFVKRQASLLHLDKKTSSWNDSVKFFYFVNPKNHGQRLIEIS